MFLKKKMLQNQQGEAKVMKKQSVIIGITLLLAIGLSGCTSNNNVLSKTNEEKIIGRWTGTPSGSTQAYIFNFCINGSVSVRNDEQTAWGTYAMTDKTLLTDIGILSNTFEYSFSDYDNKLTLIESGGTGTYAILTKTSQESPDQTQITEQTPEQLIIGKWNESGAGNIVTFYTNHSYYIINQFYGASWGKWEIVGGDVLKLTKDNKTVQGYFRFENENRYLRFDEYPSGTRQFFKQES